MIKQGFANEIIVESTVANEDIFNEIKELEKSLGRTIYSNTRLNPFEMKVYGEGSIKINNSLFTFEDGEIFDYGNLLNVSSIIVLTAGLKLKIRYMY